MEYVADFHLHSRFSRAVSPQMNLQTLSYHARQKGIEVLSVSDFTHPVWFKEVASQIEERGEGIYALKEVKGTEERKVHFLFSTEISCIYKQGGKLRRVHNLIFAPNIEKAEAIQKALLKKGANLTADGRPIIGLSSKALLELILSVDEKCFLIPCHVWTPHFGAYGSASGFDSLEECFEDLTPYIYGIETGLSSDPSMNWQVKELQNRSILSFSDAHSLPKIAREATVLELSELSYANILAAIKRPSVIASEAKQSSYGKGIATSLSARRNDALNKVAYTIEFYPEEGKYHFSGHRNCHISIGPEKIKSGGNICPKCGRKLTEGVLFRVQQLAGGHTFPVEKEKDENGVVWISDPIQKHPPFVKLVPLLEIIAESLHVGVGSKKVQDQFTLLYQSLGSELAILLQVPLEQIAQKAGEKIAEGVAKVRREELIISPGFDGEYGKVTLWEDELPQKENQLSLDV